MFTSASKEDLQAKERRTEDDIKEGVRRVKADVRGASHTLRDAANSVGDDLQDMAHEAGRYAREFAGNAEENLITSIRENPLKSGMIALGVGFVLGFLFRR